MALIHCPECGKEISDQAVACPHCGMPIASSTPIDPPETMSDANAFIQDPFGEDLPPVAATQTGAEPAQPKRNNMKTIAIAAICIVVLLMAIIAGIAISKQKAAAARAEYIETLSSARYMMLLGGADAEEVCIMVHDIWYNTIFEESDAETDAYTKRDSGYGSGVFYSDFDTSIGNYYASAECIALLDNITENQATVADLMKQLSNPTDEFDRCYDVISDLYDVYLRFTNLALEPGGYNLSSYTSTYSELDDDFMTYYNKLDTLIPSE